MILMDLLRTNKLNFKALVITCVLLLMPVFVIMLACLVKGKK